MLLLSSIKRSDYPPTFKIYVCPSTSERADYNSPSLKVTGLGEEGCRFQLVTPSEFELWRVYSMCVRADSLAS